jgi:hypothetical protein
MLIDLALDPERKYKIEIVGLAQRNRMKDILRLAPEVIKALIDLPPNSLP